MTGPTDMDIDMSIYPMPMFVTFAVRDLERSARAYGALGFKILARIPSRGSPANLIHLRRMRYQDILLVPGPPAPAGVKVSFAAGRADLHNLADSLGAGDFAIDGPHRTAWFTLDLTLSDADGNRITLTAPRDRDRDAAHTWVARNIETHAG